MAAQEKTKVTKNGQIKTINKKDVKDYIAAGWQEVKTSTNPFANAAYGTLNTPLKK